MSVDSCAKCRLALTRHCVVRGRGAVPATLLFLGEGPGVSEDLLGEAFVGPAGQLLDKMLRDAGLQGVPVYFTNCVLCRPCDSKGGANREPAPDEIAACRTNVLQIVDAVCPQEVILVGDTAKRHLRRVFAEATCITHPSALLRLGGPAAPNYRENIIKMEAIRVRL